MTHPYEAALRTKAAANGNVVNVVPYEILCAPIAPIPDVPYVQQGFFLQLTNLTGSTISVGVGYFSQPLLAAPKPPIMLTANYIENNNMPVDYTSKFLNPPQAGSPGFYDIPIASNATYLFGVQAILLPTQSQTKLGTTPQESFTSRGFAFFVTNTPASLLTLATIRQAFTDYNAAGQPIGFSQSAYPVPVTTL